MENAGICITMRKDGRYMGKFVTGYGDDRKAQYQYVYGKTYEEAESKAMIGREIASRFLSGRYITVRKVYQDWLNAVINHVKESTLANYKNKFEKHILPEFGDIPCADLTAGRINAFINKKLADGLSASYTLVHEATNAFKERVSNVLEETVPNLCEEVVKTVVTKKRERTKETIEEAVRDHLRGFARTIPSFLMAYGDEETTISTFDMIIPDDVFYEVTSITLDQFRFLRDGGSYTDADTGEEKRYPGKLFDPVVFDDSIKEFLSLRTRLGNYFDETHTEDIFDYIPPQKTNQIFTPKRIVKQMVDMLEQENPGCFDDPGKTFADLYMKSGLYIAEIVKRLFNSDGMKQAFPDETQRLQHIFEHQVYGLAPTEIIYQIALHFILGFDGGELIEKHHLRQCDALPLAKDGTLETRLDSIFG